MRSALAISTALFAALSGFLFLELRDTWSSFNSASVDQIGSSLHASLELKAMLDAGEIDSAILHLEKIQKGQEFQLSEIAGELRSPSWRWGDQHDNVRKAEQYLSAK